VFSVEAGEETVHCQGHAVFRPASAPAALDLDRLKSQMDQRTLNARDAYAIFAKMGLDYGPAHLGITAVHFARQQLLALLRRAAAVEATADEYVLHPSLLDSVLQASIGLVIDVSDAPTEPCVPFVLGSLRVIAACTKDLFAWVRRSECGRPDDKITK